MQFQLYKTNSLKLTFDTFNRIKFYISLLDLLKNKVELLLNDSYNNTIKKYRR